MMMMIMITIVMIISKIVDNLNVIHLSLIYVILLYVFLVKGNLFYLYQSIIQSKVSSFSFPRNLVKLRKDDDIWLVLEVFTLKL